MGADYSSANFFLGLAAVAILIFLLNVVQQCLSNLHRDKTENDNSANQNRKESRYKKAERGLTTLISHIDAITDAINSYHRKRDSHERNKSINDTKTLIALSAAALFSAVALIIAGINTYLVGGQLEEMRADQRPWMRIVRIDPNIEDGKITYNHVFTNVGRSPTVGLATDSKIVDGNELSLKLDRLCGDFVKNGFKVPNNRFSGIPKDKWLVPWKHMPHGIDPVSFADLKKIRFPFVISCIAYGSPYDRIIHVTKAMSQITSETGAIQYTYTTEAD